MGNHETKNESEDENEIEGTLEDTKRVVANNAKWVLRELDALKAQVKALQEEIEAMQRSDNTGFKHQNDGGWFD
jgi:outer membrane protein TolC